MAATVTDERPVPGALVQVRGQRWVVSTVDEQQESTLVTLQSVEDGRYGDTLSVIWEVEPGRRTLPSGSLPEVGQGTFDSPDRLAAFLDAVRWGAVASADVKTLQAPFRSGVAIEDYQLEPVARALDAPASTSSSPTTSASARRSRRAWSPRNSSSASADARSSSSARPA